MKQVKNQTNKNLSNKKFINLNGKIKLIHKNEVNSKNLWLIKIINKVSQKDL